MAVKLPQGVSKKELTADFFNEHLWYNKETGWLHWKPRSSEMFTEEWQFKAWNKKYSYQPAGTTKSVDKGYAKVQITLAKNTFSAHRIIAVISGLIGSYGDSKHIDHRDGDPSNNTLSNLRLADSTVNARNRKKRKGGKNKVTGVYWAKHAKKYHVCIGRGPGKSKSLGYFDDWFDAVCARKSMEESLSYSLRHGKKL